MAPASAKGGSSSKSDKIPSKKALFDDDSSSSSSEDDQEDGGATLGPAATSAQLKINEDYARKFEHNKKREELHRLQEKYGENGDEPSASSSEDESEDDEAVLITEDLDAEISATLQAIKNKDPRIYDKDAVFYKPFDPADLEKEKEKKEKPIYLKDYHRERYMAGDVGADEDKTADPQVPRTYAQEQADLKNAILSEINNAAEEEEWSDDDAFIKPVKKDEPAATVNGVHPSRVAHVELTEVDVKNADKNPEEYLSKFMASKAWAPPEGSNWQAFESDDGEDDNDDIADKFEHAYNMRFEDPTKSNEFLSTYSRNMANARSARKEVLTGRKRLRQLEKEKKEAEKKQREEERARLRTLKVNEASDRLAKIKQAAGLSGKSFTDEEWLKLLDDAWDDDKWEEEMKKRFDDKYYAEADDAFRGSDASDDDEEEAEGSDAEEDKKSKKKKKPKKPKWDDDIDIKDIVPDYVSDDEVQPEVLLSDEDLAMADAPAATVESSDEDSDEQDRPSKKRKTTKDLKKEKIAAKRAAAAERAKIEALVDTKLELEQPRALAGSSSSKKKPEFSFRYRETSPTSFGLTARDILLAPSDAALNEFAGLKKLAAFRDAEKKRKDKKKLGKKARLRQWRRDTFGKGYEETGPTYGFEALLKGEEKSEDKRASGANAVKAHRAPTEKKEEKEKPKPNAEGIVEGERKKKRKRSKNKGKKEDEE
ncbi:KRI1-like family C-terminal-domain-containing protein [Podospora australis]|uniref:KRI1-like family C-terminal-domain-containing protein n=1 Tax=Podospora australis TaxID=1536484 RepID=A0AAN7AQ80_9PEZI|nr:KRI1-like family C-terminal-domain-containing protein [Podospora australis]